MGQAGKPGSVMAAMSGGIDSTVAAMLALRDGFICTGAMMNLHHSVNSAEKDAKDAAGHLGIPFHVFDFSRCFNEMVVKRFVNTYLGGRTPNPCIECNKRLKFGLLLQKARELGNDFLITGHYARIERDTGGRYLLKKGYDSAKDQSYVLYSLTQEQLSYIRLPLGSLSKLQVRELANNAGFNNTQSRESQDLCFVPDGDYAGFITEYTGQAQRKGRFTDVDGHYLGDNKGICHFTIGQRRGLGLAMPYPMYVLDILPENDTVVIGRDELLYSKTLNVKDINLIAFDSLDSPVRARVKIRYKHTEQPAMVYQTGSDTLRIDFDEPQRAITRGQAAVIYDGDTVIGGGTIA